MYAEPVLGTLVVILLALIIHHHAIYPWLLRRLARKGRPDVGSQACTRTLPRLDVIVPAYREAEHIEALVAMLGAQDYPADQVRIVIACDGSPDGTPALALAAASRLPAGSVPVHVADFPENRGKVALLNAMIGEAGGEVIVLLDASSAVEPDFLLRVAAPFSDPSVGVVAPAYDLSRTGSVEEREYWRYQTRIKQAEADFAAPIGVHGAGYAFRRAAFEPMPRDTINDDVVLPMRIVERGYRALYRQDIRVAERDVASSSQDRARRRRIGAGNFQQTILLAGLGWRCGWRMAFLFLSGKALRAVMPIVLAALLAASFGLLAVSSSFWVTLLVAGQLGGYGLALLAEAFPALRKIRVLRALHYAVTGYAAMGRGIVDLALGRFRDERRPALEVAAGLFVDPKTDRMKRLLDVVVGSAAFVVFLLLAPFIALAIRLDSAGPIFYRQLRVGRALPDRTELFHLVKFRTMRVDAESGTGAVWASKGDPRVTRLGRFLRKTRLDELPQCLNVLRGEMSIVGPRPERPAFFNKLEGAIPFYVERTFGLRPGVTGLAQVSTGYDSTIDDVRLKILYDHTYALRIRSPWQCFTTDLGIMLKTVMVMGLGMGR